MAVLFTALQGMEYVGVSYTITDSVFGSTFFMGTGFHGFVILSLFLLILLYIYKNNLLIIKDNIYKYLINIKIKYINKKFYIFSVSPVVA
jgi:heme/copper-type cytochrome/quinol oxidase subunit 3